MVGMKTTKEQRESLRKAAKYKEEKDEWVEQPAVNIFALLDDIDFLLGCLDASRRMKDCMRDEIRRLSQ